MGTFKTFVESKGITTEALVGVSGSLEHWGNDGRALLSKRVAKRRGADKDKKYAELNLKKPTLGRGVSAQQVAAALEGKSQPRKVRTKLFRAVNQVLAAKKQPAVADFKILFEGSEVKKGKKPKEAAAAGAGGKK
jgi:hypothetical protein